MFFYQKTILPYKKAASQSIKAEFKNTYFPLIVDEISISEVS
jgi:hypothetical protein